MDVGVAIEVIAEHLGLDAEDVKLALAPVGQDKSESGRREWLRLCRLSAKGFCGKGTVLNVDHGGITDIHINTSLKALDKLIGVTNGG